MKPLMVCVVMLGLVTGCTRQPESSTGATAVPLYGNLGDYRHEITTGLPEARRYFDQGVALSYAFNHAEAIRSFKQAAAIDPECAMCYWGVAFALGPNINAPITPEAAKEAFAAIGEARKHAPKASTKERAYIEALAKRYAADPSAERAALDAAYADAMRELVKQFPDDLDAATLFAQSMMDTSPWNYWNHDGSPRPLTNDVLSALESVLKRDDKHIGAIHLYIHAVEASPDPKRAEPYADRLAALAPGAGHLVHMPAHIYLRTGRYNDASVSNEQAMKADAAYLQTNRASGNMTYEIGYVPHNPHFLVMTTSMEGRRADALRAAEQVKAKMHADMLHDPSMGGMVQHMTLTPLFTKVRFGMWDEVLAEPAPPEALVYMRAIWHAARTMAYAARKQFKEADSERTTLAKLKDGSALKSMYVSSVNTAAPIVAIAYEVASGELRTAQKRANDAARHFTTAASLEDGLIYMEPPDWPIPVRQLQGAALLVLGRTREAEHAFRNDLAKFPNNGWSLSGLRASLEQQRRIQEAADISSQFEQSWRRSDIQITGARAVR